VTESKYQSIWCQDEFVVAKSVGFSLFPEKILAAWLEQEGMEAALHLWRIHPVVGHVTNPLENAGGIDPWLSNPRAPT
jgi:hypothetical protein